MKKGLKITLTIILVLVLVIFVGFTYFVGKGVFDGMTNVISREDTVKNISFYEDEYRDLEKEYKVEKFKVNSENNDHEIPAIIVSSHGKENENIAILLHGIGGTKESMSHVAKLFIDMGYDCLIFDQRNSGENMADYNTFGVLESDDCLDMINYAIEHMDYRGKLLLYGESLGGATATIAASKDDSNIDYIILDCPVSDSYVFADEIFNKIEKEQGLPKSYMKFAGNIFLKSKLGFTMNEINSADYIRGKELSEAVLIINSKADKVTPYEMGKEIYDAIKGDKKELHTEENYGHIKFAQENPKKFKEVIKNFLKKFQ
ncbi:MAG: alpha/beta fold hydrolase [Lagierella massiliensis]|nr:alpha/beta fold hydrolase [Lagierella massiliensis]